MVRKMAPLTPEERQFAAENSNMIFDYMVKHHLNFSEFYGMLACRYIMSVRDWFIRPELHKWKFSTLAYQAMHGTYASWCRNQKRKGQKVKIVSLNALVRETEDEQEFANKVSDEDDSTGDLVVCKLSVENAFNKLSLTQKRMCGFVINGYSQMDVSRKMVMPQPYVSNAMKRFRQNYQAEIF